MMVIVDIELVKDIGSGEIRKIMLGQWFRINVGSGNG